MDRRQQLELARRIIRDCVFILDVTGGTATQYAEQYGRLTIVEEELQSLDAADSVSRRVQPHRGAS
jgi:hypothetical protein